MSAKCGLNHTGKSTAVKQQDEGIAMEYCDTEIIAVSGTVSKIYKVIKEQK